MKLVTTGLYAAYAELSLTGILVAPQDKKEFCL